MGDSVFGYRFHTAEAFREALVARRQRGGVAGEREMKRKESVKVKRRSWRRREGSRRLGGVQRSGLLGVLILGWTDSRRAAPSLHQVRHASA